MNRIQGPVWKNAEAIIERLGWVLLHSVWQFVLLAFLASVIVRLMQRRSSAMRYGVLVCSMAISVLAPTLTWIQLPRDAQRQESIAATSLNEKGSHASGMLNPKPRDTLSNDASDTESIVATSDAIAVLSTASWSWSVEAILRPWLAWIVGAWSLGVILCSSRPLMGWYSLRRLRSVGVSFPASEVIASMRNVSERLGLAQAVQVMQSTLVQVPIVVGYLRPVILLPVSIATNIPASQLEAVLAHELAHIRRHDFVVNVVQTLIETFFFYHPAIWWLSHQIRIERENCCDDTVVQALGNRIEYGRALVAIEQLRGENYVLALGVSGGSLLERVRRITGNKTTSPSFSPPWALCLMLATLGAVWMSFGQSLQGQSEIRAPKENNRSITSIVQPEVASDLVAVKQPLALKEKYIAEFPDGLSIELVGITKNTDSAKDGWKPDGSPIKDDIGYWPSTFLLQRTFITTDSTITESSITGRYSENGEHPEPDIGAVDILFEFCGLKSKPSIGFNIGKGGSFVPWPLKDPYQLRISTFGYEPSSSGHNVLSNVTMQVWITEEPWGRYVKINPEGTLEDPLQPDEQYAAIYNLIEVTATKKHDQSPFGKTIEITWPSDRTDLIDPLHRYDFELRAIDSDGHEYLGSKWEGHQHTPAGLGKTSWGIICQILPEGKTLSHYEYRVRPYRHRVTFENVSLEPGKESEVKVKTETFPK